MCLIIIKNNKQGKFFTENQLSTIARENPDGLGIAYLDTGEVKKYDSSQYDKLLVNRPFIAHFRYATKGYICKENTHPFKIGSTHFYLFQNGTNKNLGDNQKTDTENLADILANIPFSNWLGVLSITDSRYIIFDAKQKTYFIANKHLWHRNKDTGLLLSKKQTFTTAKNWQKYDFDYWYDKPKTIKKPNIKTDFEQCNLLAVYGTLRKGYANNYLLNGSKFIGSFETAEKFPHKKTSIPYVANWPGYGEYIPIELYELKNEAQLSQIDILEGHPNWYKRELTQIYCNNSHKVYEAWLYFNDDAFFDEADIDNFNQLYV
jgi:gamma-glutamylaminecyclotransferase